MEQRIVTDFFLTRKFNTHKQPSKRRKVEMTSVNVDMASLDRTNKIIPNISLNTLTQFEDTPSKITIQKQPEILTAPFRKATCKKKTVRRTPAKSTRVKQKLISDFSAKSEVKPATHNAYNVNVTEAVTSCWDEHKNLLTPKKSTESMISTKKRTRNCSLSKEDEATPEKQSVPQLRIKTDVKAKKKLELAAKELSENVETDPDTTVNLPSVENLQKTTRATLSANVLAAVEKCKALQEKNIEELSANVETDPDTTVNLPSVENLQKTTRATLSANVLAAVEKCKALQEKNIEELTANEEIDPDATVNLPSVENLQKTTQVALSDNVLAALEKCKALQEKNIETDKCIVEDIGSKLAQVKNLDDLKKRLALMKETKEKLNVSNLKRFDISKLTVTGNTSDDVKPQAPAYERYHHLAVPSIPTLTLPYKYKRVEEQFQGMDQVVSMLHNRNEVCTFSKLKAAVQKLTKQTFEMRHVGQIKTVYPSAYDFRQEKGLHNMQGIKDPEYQLTVEARLEDARTSFMASQLLYRKNVFHNKLINIVKQHHKEFLANLIRPLTIPDDKITRWHPKFALDEVPDIVESQLPEAPGLHKYQTAKDVLDSTRGRLAPKIEAALKSTVEEEAKTLLINCTNPIKALPNTSKPAIGTVKGIPQSLLEKIRAKEAANMVGVLTRDPKEEKHIGMLKRLPDLMRIIRSHFVTEKKPALPWDSVVQKILDSYKSCIAPGDIEGHVNMCMEVVPEWISCVKIKTGRYIKIDKNVDLQQLTDKVNNILKGKQ